MIACSLKSSIQCLDRGSSGCTTSAWGWSEGARGISLSSLGTPIIVEGEVDGGTNNKEEWDSNEWSEEQPGDGNNEDGESEADNDGEEGSSDGGKSSEEPADEWDPLEELDDWGEEKVESKDLKEDSEWSEARAGALDGVLLAIEIGSCGDLLVSGVVDDLLEHDVKEAVDTHADVAAEWASIGLVSLSIGRLGEWHVNFVWVPLSEGEYLIVILHLLGNDSGNSALVVREGDSHLSNMLSNDRVVLS